MDKSKNELIRKRRRKMLRKRIFFLTILLVATLITLCLKLPYFNIQNIYVSNNNTIPSEQIISSSGIAKGTNIFYLNVSKIKSNITNNPYVLDAKINRKLPNAIEIAITERAAVFYAEKGKKFLIIDKDGIVLEERDNIDKMNLVKLIGIDTSKTNIGKVVPCNDSRKLNYISDITEIILKNANCKAIKSVDITDSLNLQAYYNNMCIKLGTNEKLTEKLNKAINIITDKNLSAAKGYVDVSFDGNPVYYIEK